MCATDTQIRRVPAKIVAEHERLIEVQETPDGRVLMLNYWNVPASYRPGDECTLVYGEGDPYVALENLTD